MGKVARNSVIVTVFTVIGFLLTFLANILIAAKFGVGKEMDIFFTVIVIPVFICNIYKSALLYSFIPAFSDYKKKSNKIWDTISSFINLNVAIALLVCLIGIIFSNQILRIIAPGFDDYMIYRASNLLAIVLPMIVLAVINEIFAGLYYSSRKYVVPSLTKVVRPILIIIFVFFFHSMIKSTSILFAMLGSYILQTVFYISRIKTIDEFHYRFVLYWKNEEVNKLFKLMIPLVLGMIIYRALPIYDRYFLSQLSTGSISQIGYAQKLFELLNAIIVSGIAIAIFPVMSMYVTDNKTDSIKTMFDKSIRMLFYICVPFTVFLSFFGVPVIRVIFEHGKLVYKDSIGVYKAFIFYLIALPASVLGQIVSQTYYIYKKNILISIISILLSFSYILLCYLFIDKLKYLTIPIVFAFYYNVSLLILIYILRRFIIRISLNKIYKSFLKNIFVAVVIILLMYPVYQWLKEYHYYIKVLVPTAGFILYFLVGKFVIDIEEARMIWDNIFENKVSKVKDKYYK